MGNCVHGSHLHMTTSRSIRTVAAGRRTPPTLFADELDECVRLFRQQVADRDAFLAFAGPSDRRDTPPRGEGWTRSLNQPLTARIATCGPTVRPVRFLWEDGAFWVLTGPWARLFDHVRSATDRCPSPTCSPTRHCRSPASHGQHRHGCRVHPHRTVRPWRRQLYRLGPRPVIGLTTGTCSSMFTATPPAMELNKRGI